MENISKNTLVNPYDNPIGIASEQTLATPHFDEISIQNARPAVPLERNKARRFWPLALVLMCTSSLVGGALGIALLRYENRSPAASVAPEQTSQNESYGPLSPSIADPKEKANDADTEAKRASPPTVGSQPISDTQGGDARATLHGAFDEWIAATNARDIQRQMDFYNQTVNAFYLRRNVPREAVRAEKSRVFGRANVIDIRAGAPGIRLSPDERTATMRFRKTFAIEGGGEDRRGEVVQELRWHRTADGWKIVSERDVSVIN